ncbi:MAG: pyridoxamine 5'-phosphate oxidase family protein [Actinomycetota bacterium]
MATAAEVYRFRPDPDEIADVLSKRVVATVGTTNADGSIHLAYVLFLFEDDRILIETSSVTRKARNVASRPAASFLVQGRASSGRMAMVSGEGTARLLEGDEAQQRNRRLRAKYLVPDVLDAIERAWAPLDDVTIEITPARWRSWTGTLLHREAERELGGDYAGAWLPDED